MNLAVRLVALALIAMSVLAACRANPAPDTAVSVTPPTDTPLPTPFPTPAPPDLKVLDVSGWHRDGGQVIFQGQVTNQSDHTLNDVTVHVTYYSANLQTVKQVDGALDVDALEPGDTSDFTVSTSDDPAITQATIEFRGPNGTLSAASET